MTPGWSSRTCTWWGRWWPPLGGLRSMWSLGWRSQTTSCSARSATPESPTSGSYLINNSPNSPKHCKLTQGVAICNGHTVNVSIHWKSIYRNREHVPTSVKSKILTFMNCTMLSLSEYWTQLVSHQSFYKTDAATAFRAMFPGSGNKILDDEKLMTGNYVSWWKCPISISVTLS